MLIPGSASRLLDLDVRSDEQRAMFHELAGLYHRAGVLSDNGFAPALASLCPHRRGCWQDCTRLGDDGTQLSEDCDDGSIFFPWIGREYREGGVCVVGWNLNHRGHHWFGLAEEWVIARRSAAALGNGSSTVDGSRFAYRSMAAAAAVREAMRGVSPVARPRPSALATELEHVARVQAVKCSPRGHRSNPSNAMNHACPPFFLANELRILKPSALIVCGLVTRDAALPAIRDLDIDDKRSWLRKTTRGYGRRQSMTAWGPLDVFVMWHPSYTRWPEAQSALIEDLAAHPPIATI